MAAKGNIGNILLELATYMREDSFDKESYLIRFEKFYSKNESHFYAEITQIIFFDIQSDEDIDFLEKHLNILLSNIPDDKNNLRIQLNKIIDHIQLSVNQKQLIDQYQETMNRQLESSAQKLLSAEDKLKSAENKLQEFDTTIEGYKEVIEEVQKEVKSKYDNIITQFITILGIFSAILMGAFGSIQGFTSLFNNAYNMSTGKLLVISAVGCAGVLAILFFLLNVLGKMTNYSISSCNCNRKKVRSTGWFSIFRSLTNTNDDGYCNCSIFEKYPVYVMINYCLFFVAFAGLSLMIITTNAEYIEFLQTTFGPFASIVTLFLFALLGLYLFHTKVIIKKRT
jgi:hypothetical protein